MRGSFRVEHEGRTIARYLIDIEIPEDYPSEPPLVREVGGVIPWTAERHVFSNGEACLFYPAAYWLQGFDRLRFVDFLDGPVRNYFLFQACKDADVEWPHGEQAHDTRGAIEYLAEQLGMDAPATCRCILQLAEGRLTAYSPCPCNSGSRVRACHLKVLRVQRLVPQALFRAEASRLLDQLR